MIFFRLLVCLLFLLGCSQLKSSPSYHDIRNFFIDEIKIGKNQTVIASSLGVDSSTVSRFLKGEIKHSPKIFKGFIDNFYGSEVRDSNNNLTDIFEHIGYKIRNDLGYLSIGDDNREFFSSENYSPDYEVYNRQIWYFKKITGQEKYKICAEGVYLDNLDSISGDATNYGGWILIESSEKQKYNIKSDHGANHLFFNLEIVAIVKDKNNDATNLLTRTDYKIKNFNSCLDNWKNNDKSNIKTDRGRVHLHSLVDSYSVRQVWRIIESFEKGKYKIINNLDYLDSWGGPQKNDKDGDQGRVHLNSFSYSSNSDDCHRQLWYFTAFPQKSKYKILNDDGCLDSWGNKDEIGKNDQGRVHLSSFNRPYDDTYYDRQLWDIVYAEKMRHAIIPETIETSLVSKVVSSASVFDFGIRKRNKHSGYSLLDEQK